MRSLRIRLLVSSSVAIAVVLGLLGIAIYWAVRNALAAEFDRDLLVEAQSLSAMAEGGVSGVTFEFEPQQMPAFRPGDGAEYFEAWLSGGNVVTRSASLGDTDLGRPAAASTAGIFQNVRLPTGKFGREVALAFTPRVDADNFRTAASHVRPPLALIVVARSTATLHHTFERLRALLLALVGSAIALSGAVLVFMIHRAMQPVHRLSRDLEQLREDNLAAVLHAADVPTELMPMVDRLNALLARLAAAFERERGFSADVAHELRTPLAGMQATLEVCRSRSRSTAEYEAAIDRARAMLGGMATMVETLLLLARAESGQLPRGERTIDFNEAISEQLEAVQPRIAIRQLGVRSNLTACQAMCDDRTVHIVFKNLVDNAVSYADEGGTIDISTGRVGGMCVLRLTNTGSKVPSADVPRLFERFWRGDAAREVGTHHGLGLALCRRLVAAQHGTIEITSEAGGEFVVTVSLPSVSSHVPSPIRADMPIGSVRANAAIPFTS